MERREVRGSREVGGEARRARMKGRTMVKVTARRGQLRRPNWLPDGWIVEVGVGEDGGQVKHYTSPVSRKTFSSKEEVLHYLRVTKFDDRVSDTSSSEHNKQNVVGQGRNSPEWLPQGWILEIKTRLSGDRAGEKYKSYFDPFSGSRFYSKSEVLLFLKSGNLYTPTSGEKQRFKANATDNVLAQIEYSPDGLPQGWIKETKFRKSSSCKRTRRDPYYTDPVSGYVFRSFKDAIHYVETRELGQYASGPRKSRIDEMYSLEKESPIPIPVKELKSPGFTRRCLFTEETSTSNGEDIQQTKVGTDRKRRRMPEADDPVNTSKHGEQKAKRVRPPRKGSKLEKEEEGGEGFLEPAMIVERPSEPPTEVTPVAPERKQRRSKGKLASLPRRSSKRLAGLEAAPATDLVIHRPSCQLQSNGRSNRIENSVLLADPGMMKIVEAVSLPERLLLMGQTSEDKPPSHQPLYNGWCNGIDESVPVKQPERKDTAVEASQGEEMLLTGQTSEAKPPSRQPLSSGCCNGIEESAHSILIEPKRKYTADEISQGERVLLTGQAPEDKPSCSQLLSNDGCTGFTEFAPLMEDTADEASKREQVLLRGQTSEDRPPSQQPLSNGRFKGIEESALSLEPERMDFGEEASQGEQVLLTGQTSQHRPSSPLALTLGTCWDDPCIQFAVKTLMGEIPVLDVGIAIDEYVQKQLSSAEVLNLSAPAANVASANQDFDLAKLLGPMELPRTQNLPVNDEGKPCPVEKLPSHSEASRVGESTSRVQG